MSVLNANLMQETWSWFWFFVNLVFVSIFLNAHLQLTKIIYTDYINTYTSVCFRADQIPNKANPFFKIKFKDLLPPWSFPYSLSLSTPAAGHFHLTPSTVLLLYVVIIV